MLVVRWLLLWILVWLFGCDFIGMPLVAFVGCTGLLFLVVCLLPLVAFVGCTGVCFVLCLSMVPPAFFSLFSSPVFVLFVCPVFVEGEVRFLSDV